MSAKRMKAIKDDTGMERGRGGRVMDWTEMKRQNDARVGERSEELEVKNKNNKRWRAEQNPS